MNYSHAQCNMPIPSNSRNQRVAHLLELYGIMITLLGDLWLDLPISYPYPEDSRASQELILEPLQSSWRWIFPRWRKSSIRRLRAM